MSRPLKVFVALPTHRYVEPEAYRSLKDCLFPPSEVYEVSDHVEMRGSPNIYYQRYNLAQQFLKSSADIYLYYDSDQVLMAQPGDMDRFFTVTRPDGTPAPITCPLIVRRVFPHLPTIYTYAHAAADKLDKPPPLEDFRDKTEPFEVQYCSGGVVAIRRDILSRIDQPFMPVFQKNKLILGTDYSLYAKARELDPHACWCDPRLRVGHLGTFPFMMDDYYNLLDSGELRRMADAGQLYTKGG